MAIEYFHINEDDYNMLEQLTELEAEVHGGRASGLDYLEVYSCVKYGQVYVAIEYDEILGAAYFYRDFNNPGKCFLYEILVKPSETGKHIGESLLLSAFEDLKNLERNRIRIIEVCVHSSNANALKVYKDALGFNVINSKEDGEYEETEYFVLRKTL